MESEDHAAVHEQPQQSRVHVFVRPLDDAASRYADARICSSTLFDVILHLALPRSGAAASSAGSQSASSSPTFLHVQRCLHDFAQLERDVRSEARVADTAAMVLPAIVDEIRAYVTTKRSSPSHDDDESRTTLHSKDLLEARFAWQLEHFLSALVGDPVIVRRSHALKQFLHGDVADRMLHDFGEDEDEKETYAHLVETLMAGVHSQSQHREHVQDERIASGCSFEHAVQIKVTDNEEDEEKEEEGVSQNAHLVLWKFASRGDRVYFSARFSEQQDGQQATHGDPYSNADPYSSANAYDGDATPAGACGSAGSEDGDGALRMERPFDRYMAQYRTRYAFPTEQPDERFIYGHFVAKASGALVLEWANEDTSSVVSKPLDFHVHVIPLAQTGIAGDTFLKFLDAADGQEDPLWVHRLLQKSTVVSVEEILDAPDSDEEEELRSFGDVPVAASYSESEKLARLQEEKHFHAQRSKELEDRVLQLEDALSATKKELKKAQDDMEISGEIYKASLETIAQLESVAQRKAGQRQAREASAGSIPATTAAAARDSLKSTFVDAKEHQRVVDLCTTFQEQCLWRSIEVAESEKRSLALEGQLAETAQANAALLDQLAAQNATVSKLQAENHKLKAHKSILVQEVKKLQPYSQVNLAALVQDAQEARMMQRSLQAQLDSRNTTTLRSAAIPGRPSAPAAADEDGAAGFVVIESKDHCFDGATSE